MQTSFYPDRVMDYLINLPNAGIIEKSNDNKLKFLLSEQSNLDQGIVIKLFIQYKKLDEKKNTAIISKVRYLVYGNGYIIASLAMLSEEIHNKKIKIINNYNFDNIINKLGIPNSKVGSLKVVKRALEEIYSKYNNK